MNSGTGRALAGRFSPVGSREGVCVFHKVGLESCPCSWTRVGPGRDLEVRSPLAEPGGLERAKLRRKMGSFAGSSHHPSLVTWD